MWLNLLNDCGHFYHVQYGIFCFHKRSVFFCIIVRWITVYLLFKLCVFVLQISDSTAVVQEYIWWRRGSSFVCRGRYAGYSQRQFTAEDVFPWAAQPVADLSALQQICRESSLAVAGITARICLRIVYTLIYCCDFFQFQRLCLVWFGFRGAVL